ncbi:MAG: ASCH domain-containing protein [Phycisphaerales bacterium]|nr:ASCH domain-containing protein [Phycisphaerales bacterium]
MPENYSSIETHLMIVHPRYAAMILSGQKTVEARLGSDRRAPFNRVEPGDIVYIKPTSQRVIAKAIVYRVDQYEGLDHSDIDRLRELYNKRVLGDDSFWDAKADANIATFITFEKITRLNDEMFVPEELLKPSRNAWRVLSQLRKHSQAA